MSMRERANAFKEGKIIKRHMHKEFLELRQTIDILPRMMSASRSDMEILWSWEQYFRALNVPYVITEQKTQHGWKKTLWKGVG